MSDKRTCNSCTRAKKTKVRGQYFHLCNLTGKSIPWKTCWAYVNRHAQEATR